eukprot:CAMPEP_0119035866 /NCGR_PEP_ID=MMETSP1177-20130426/3125_1 /TAXON_ID=2985 /ORGANISM="Ochromonas sp, Strain CCMP1899" /LENGTH=535 /DNA_ID=CAMNT_0006994721 /DNA_START=39 /DNA_END=1643 /DNA_ORIENTATION=-
MRSGSFGEDGEDEERSGSNTSGSSFTKKLYEILDSADATDIICWTADGASFEVKEPKRLELQILPKYFRHARFQSFVRQLNFYSFKKVSKERSSWIYSHDCFQRNKPDLLDRLRRKTNTSTLPNVSTNAKRTYEIGDQTDTVHGSKVPRGEGGGFYGQNGLPTGQIQWGYDDEYQMQPLSSDGIPARAPVLTRRVTEDLPSDRSRSPATEYSGNRSPVSDDISEEETNTEGSQISISRHKTRDSTFHSFNFSNEDTNKSHMSDIYGCIKEDDHQIRSVYHSLTPNETPLGSPRDTPRGSLRGSTRGVYGVRGSPRGVPPGNNIVLEEPLGDGSHALLSFCMQRNPWLYVGQTPTPGPADGVMNVVPVILHKDIMSCLIDTPSLRDELENYIEALYPSPFLKEETNTDKVRTYRKVERVGRFEDSSGSDGEDGEGNITDGSNDCDENLGVQARFNKKKRNDSVDEMRSFTAYASIRLQEISALVCEQEMERNRNRLEDKVQKIGNWDSDNGAEKDIAAGQVAAQFIKALETCTETW